MASDFDKPRKKKSTEKTGSTSDDPMVRVAAILIKAFKSWYPAVFDMFGMLAIWEAWQSSEVGRNDEDMATKKKKDDNELRKTRFTRNADQKRKELNEITRKEVFDNLRAYELKMHGRFRIAPELWGAAEFVKEEPLHEDSVAADAQLWRVVDARIHFVYHYLINVNLSRIKEYENDNAIVLEKLDTYLRSNGVSPSDPTFVEISNTARSHVIKWETP